MMTWYDYLIVIIPLCFVYGMALYTRRYIRGVVDFLSTGRLCGRYVMSVAGVASGLPIIGVVAYVEVHYKTGFALPYWNSLMLPISITSPSLIFVPISGACSSAGIWNIFN